MDNNEEDQERTQQWPEYSQPQQLIRTQPEQPNFPGWSGGGMQVPQYSHFV